MMGMDTGMDNGMTWSLTGTIEGNSDTSGHAGGQVARNLGFLITPIRKGGGEMVDVRAISTTFRTGETHTKL